MSRVICGFADGGNVADGVTFTSVFKPGQVLFGKRRAYQRKVAVADFTGVCSGDIYVLEKPGPECTAARVAAVHLPDRCVLRACCGHFGGEPEPENQLDEFGGF
ncbi:MAG: hypothetical protein V5B33_00100 [Candidatus Accumulibacter sp. UW20]